MDLLLVIAPDGRLHAVNPAWTASLGYAPQELTGRCLAPFVHPDDAAAAAAAIAQAAQRPLEYFEMRLRHKDGSYRWFAWRATPENGMVYANGRDVTPERKQAEQLLLASEERMQRALSAGGMGAWEWHIQSDEIVWLHGAANVHGVIASERPFRFPVAQYLQHVHPDDRQYLTQVMARAVKEGRSQRAEYRIVWPDGSVHWIEACGDLFADDAGRPQRMAGVSVDITRRKRSEHDLKFLAQASAELASLVDPQTTLDRLAYLAVPSFADWCAVDLLEPDGSLRRVAVAHTDPQKVQLAHELHRRFPPDPATSKGIWKILRSGRAELVREITGRLLAQTVRNPALRAAMQELGLRSYIGVPLSTHGKTMGIVTFAAAESGRLYGKEDLALAEDLARRAAVAMENAQLYRALRESDHAKNVFLATLAHELRNPLAAIVNGLGVLTLAAGDTARVAHYTKLMERQASHLTRLVDDLMDISRITSGKIALKKEPASLAAILHSAIETSRPHIEAGQHRLAVALPGAPTPVLADPVRLSQVFSNLLINAAKYTNPGGRIAVTLERAAGEYIVRIADNGIGIATDMLANIFQIFTQVTHPLGRARGGLGIGLSLVRGLVSLHGGRVEAFSEGPGRGSEFVVYLPQMAQDTRAEEDDGGARHEAGAPAQRILVVDDNVDAATAVADILRMLGNEVTVEHDGLAAVAAAAAMQPDVILLDIGLPGIDGYEAARRIRAQERDRRPALLIALTGWGQEDDKQRAYQAGFNRHWVKPVGLAQLKELPRAQ